MLKIKFIMGPLLFAQLAYGGYKMYQGAKQQKEAKKLAAQNVRPTYEGTELAEDMVGKLSYESQFGIDRNALTFAQEANNNQFTAGLAAMLQAGGNPNAVAGLYGASTDANEKLAISNSDRRWQKVNALAGAVDRLQQARNEEFLYNEDGPYKDTARLAAQKQIQGQQELNAGIDYAIGAYANDLSRKAYQNKPTPTMNTTPSNSVNINMMQGSYDSNMFQGTNPVQLESNPSPWMTENWTDPSNTGQFVNQNGTMVGTPGVTSLSSLYSVPGRYAGNYQVNNANKTAELLTALWSGKIKGYDAKGNPIF